MLRIGCRFQPFIHYFNALFQAYYFAEPLANTFSLNVHLLVLIKIFNHFTVAILVVSLQGSKQFLKLKKKKLFKLPA